MTNLVLTLIDILTSVIGQQETFVAFTFTRNTQLPRSTIFLLVTTRLAGAVNTNFALQTIFVGPTDLNTKSRHAFLASGTIRIDGTFMVAQISMADMICLAFSVRTSVGDTYTALLGCWDASKAFRA